MLVVRTTEDPADPVCQLVCAEQSLGLRDLAFAVDPLGLYCVQPRALGGQKARDYAYSTAAFFDLAVVGADPLAHPTAFVPARVVPDQEQGLLAPRFEPSATPLEKPRGYGAHRPTVHKPKPALLDFRQIQPIAGEGLRLGIVLARLFVQEAHRLSFLGPRAQRRPLEARKPALALVEGGVDLPGTRGAGRQGTKAALVEVVDGVARRLGATPEVFRYSRRAFSPSAGQKDLAAPEDEGIGGAQPGLRSLALLL